MPEFQLKSTQFRREREASWRELEQLIDVADRRGLRRLTAEQLTRLPSLYRSAVSALSVARAVSLDRNLLDYLENLVGRAYLCVYGTKRSALGAVLEFARRGFPQAVRRGWPQLFGAVVALALGVFSGFFLVVRDEERYYSVVPAALHQGRTPASTTDQLREVLYFDADDRSEATLDSLNLLAGFLFTHNAKIGILCFALGFAAGAPVAFLLFYNGLTLGAMGALYAGRGLGSEFCAWVLPHGITELGAVALCGMAGLIVGTSLVFPGRHGRLRSLALRGREASTIVIGAVVMLFVAAVIEGFFRQLVLDVTIRWIVAWSTLALWAAYFTFAGRDR